MATYESYDVYVDTDRDVEFRAFIATFGNAVDLIWRETQEI